MPANPSRSGKTPRVMRPRRTLSFRQDDHAVALATAQLGDDVITNARRLLAIHHQLFVRGPILTQHVQSLDAN
jgi:hypothetical protein